MLPLAFALGDEFLKFGQCHCSGCSHAAPSYSPVRIKGHDDLDHITGWHAHCIRRRKRDAATQFILTSCQGKLTGKTGHLRQPPKSTSHGPDGNLGVETYLSRWPGEIKRQRCYSVRTLRCLGLTMAATSANRSSRNKNVFSRSPLWMHCEPKPPEFAGEPWAAVELDGQEPVPVRIT